MKKKEDVKKKFPIEWSTIIVGALFLIIALAFFILLSSKTSRGFGFTEIIFSVVLAVFISLFLHWIKSITVKNAYLGVIIGIITLIIFDYSIFYRYKGPYTITFVLIASLVVLIYLGIHFFRFKNNK